MLAVFTNLEANAVTSRRTGLGALRLAMSLIVVLGCAADVSEGTDAVYQAVDSASETDPPHFSFGVGVLPAGASEWTTVPLEDGGDYQVAVDSRNTWWFRLKVDWVGDVPESAELVYNYQAIAQDGELGPLQQFVGWNGWVDLRESPSWVSLIYSEAPHSPPKTALREYVTARPS